MKISGTVSYEYLNPSSKMIFRLIFNGEFMNYENACGGLMEDNASWYFQVNINERNFSPLIEYSTSLQCLKVLFAADAKRENINSYLF